jgi:hypothetical protein
VQCDGARRYLSKMGVWAFTGGQALALASGRVFGIQPMIIVFIDGMIFRSAEKRLLAKASLRWVRVSITVIGMFVSS